MASRTFDLHSGNVGAYRAQSQDLEGAAREALSSHLGRDLTDAEWARARKNLLEFAKILRRWNSGVDVG